MFNVERTAARPFPMMSSALYTLTIARALFRWHLSHIFYSKLPRRHIDFAKRARWTRLEDVQLRPNGIHFMHAEPHMSNADVGTVHDKAPLMDRIQV